MNIPPRPVGVAGLGLIGSALVQRLIAAGIPVSGYDIDPAKMDAAATLGAQPCRSLTELAAKADRFVLAVFDTRQVESAIEGEDGLLKARGESSPCYISVSTCDPERIQALGKRVLSRGAALLEYPLSGTSQQVAQGEAVGLLAGEEALVPRIDDILTAICKRRYFLGALGNGNRAKLAVNLILGLNRAALAEGLVFAERLGLPLEEFLDVARGSAAYSQVMDVKGAKMRARDFTPHGKIIQSHKDFSLILNAAHAAGQELPLASVYRALMQDGIDRGEGDWDNSAVIEAIRRRVPRAS